MQWLVRKRIPSLGALLKKKKYLPPLPHLHLFNGLPSNSIEEDSVNQFQKTPSDPCVDKITAYLDSRTDLVKTRPIVFKFLKKYIQNMDEIDVPAIFDTLEEEIKIGRCGINTIQSRVSHI